MSISFRDIEAADVDWVETQNNLAVPNVNALSGPALLALLNRSAYQRIALHNGERAGFLIAFGVGADYGSMNYRWFSERYDDFLYVDRIVVSSDARGEGIGENLYQDLFEFAGSRVSRITCEVNERPPNPGSMRFHERLGFSIVGRQETDAGTKSVAMMAKSL